MKATRTCSVDGCDRGGQLRRGWCAAHYRRWRDTGELGPALIRPAKMQDHCNVDGCDQRHAAHGYCNIHALRFARYGDPLAMRAAANGTYGTVCSVATCERRHHAKGFCSTHFYLWKTHGSPLVRARRERGATPACEVAGCQRPHEGKGYCHSHYRRFRLYGNPLHSEPRGPRPLDAPPSLAPAPRLRAVSPRWKTAVGYTTAHRRVALTRGPASAQTCVDCGERARQWSYEHNCPQERRDRRGRAYSADPTRYAARCIPCHTAFDAARRRQAFDALRRRRGR